ncbi:uncharacterized protein Z520_03187 [Fonsecaea multimorphosa CBS 102226]|uniref:Uncharacterized protein n=1 Tax=Fonsecaea multimorphosa CBS 102226 TaxID=1442371 RepID=A0A0D2KE77_9EURO|nr:uncharacterized protein Z520_03187 [Fonsecaea multimorphosa CBS 102226]KIY01635.1 hypothetical protein Z520_03187 [Fonsecaea multimorphosa CBS 102226]OAL23108.1 hypothetical protein AYO22_06601 [Fonsecaea multimorphosa]
MKSLAPELRRMIYAHCVNIGAYGLLYVNKQFHHEFSPFVKTDFVLGFHIDPSSSTKVNFINPDDSTWGGRRALDAAYPHLDRSVLDSMPIDQFKGIRILVDPPNMSDPGQVVRGWLQSNALVTALLPDWKEPEVIPRTEEGFIIPDTRLTTRLPPITIQVRDRKAGKWHAQGFWNRSLPGFSQGQAFSDLETILTPLQRFRNADAIVLELPSDAPVDDRFDDFRSNLVSDGTRKKLFGLDISPELVWNDDDTQSIEDALHVWLDYLLDDMHGPSAAELRRDRFKFWCSWYEHQFGRRFHGRYHGSGYFGGTLVELEVHVLDLIERSFHDRFMSAREHVLAAYRDVLRRHGRSVYVYADKEKEFFELDQLVIRNGLRPELGNCETFWDVSYPTGIKPKSQNDSWENTEQIDRRFRLEPPNGLDDPTASRTFPSQLGVCPHCERDHEKFEAADYVQGWIRDYFFESSSRPELPLLLGPIEAT